MSGTPSTKQSKEKPAIKSGRTVFRRVPLKTMKGHTKMFPRIMRHVGDCIRQGGAVTMTTYYGETNKNDLYCDCELDYSAAKKELP